VALLYSKGARKILLFPLVVTHMPLAGVFFSQGRSSNPTMKRYDPPPSFSLSWCRKYAIPFPPLQHPDDDFRFLTLPLEKWFAGTTGSFLFSPLFPGWGLEGELSHPLSLRYGPLIFPPPPSAIQEPVGPFFFFFDGGCRALFFLFL